MAEFPRALCVAIVIGTLMGCTTVQPGAQVPLKVWEATKTTDPITGRSSCVVAAYDKFKFGAGPEFQYTNSLAIYPLVEMNSAFGLLVGVSSGGRIRVPTGDILWRVDDKPFRELHAFDNPGLSTTQFPAPKTGNEETDRRVADAMASSSKLVAGMSATSTMASGTVAADILREMLDGHALVFRAAAASPAYGIPTGNARELGQYTLNGGVVNRRPFPLDESFREGIRACGIVPQ